MRSYLGFPEVTTSLQKSCVLSRLIMQQEATKEVAEEQYDALQLP